MSDLETSEQEKILPITYCLLKRQNTSVGAKVIVASKNCSTKSLSNMISKTHSKFLKTRIK